VWTSDVDRGLRVARQIQSGAVFVNALAASDPRLSFGGIKRSGDGRELAAAGIREVTNLRTCWVSRSATPTPGRP
jgi:acyl-CoA reductase-like NAD-dependent aldehyde dehydrogenase